jgi:hypothetical protein
MHSYAVNTNRWRHTGLIALVAAGVLIFITPRLPGYLPTFAQSISPLLLFTILWFAVDRWLWRLPLLNGFLGIPDLNGEWEGEVRTAYDGGSAGNKDELHPVQSDTPHRLNITQRWFSIDVEYENPESSRSVSTSARFDIQGNTPELTYTYQNKPIGTTGLATAQQSRHGGTATLRVKQGSGGLELVGEYYTDEERHNHGTLRFKRVNEE